MTQERLHGEVHDIGHLLIIEDENFVRWALNRMIAEQVLEQFEADLRFQLSFEHAMEHKVENGEHRGHLLIAVLVLLAESVIHVMEVKLE